MLTAQLFPQGGLSCHPSDTHPLPPAANHSCNVTQTPAMQESKKAQGHVVTPKAARKAVQQAFAATDRAVLAACRQKGWGDGAVCVAVWVLADSAVVGNIGKPEQVPLLCTRQCAWPHQNLCCVRHGSGGGQGHLQEESSAKLFEAMQLPPAAAPAAIASWPVC